jgi:hypothetical protein
MVHHIEGHEISQRPMSVETSGLGFAERDLIRSRYCKNGRQTYIVACQISQYIQLLPIKLFLRSAPLSTSMLPEMWQSYDFTLLLARILRRRRLSGLPNDRANLLEKV